jgi:hypothetical protein
VAIDRRPVKAERAHPDDLSGGNGYVAGIGVRLPSSSRLRKMAFAFAWFWGGRCLRRIRNLRNRLKGTTKQRRAGRQPPSINDIGITKMTSHFYFGLVPRKRPGECRIRLWRVRK